jgi:hypothetical protein
MVTKNQWEEAGWWDDLPPKIRERFAAPPAAPVTVPAPACEPPFPAPFRGLGDYGVLAVLFFAVAVANVILLLFVLAFVDGVALPGPFQAR